MKDIFLQIEDSDHYEDIIDWFNDNKLSRFYDYSVWIVRRYADLYCFTFYNENNNYITQFLLTFPNEIRTNPFSEVFPRHEHLSYCET